MFVKVLCCYGTLKYFYLVVYDSKECNNRLYHCFYLLNDDKPIRSTWYNREAYKYDNIRQLWEILTTTKLTWGYRINKSYNDFRKDFLYRMNKYLKSEYSNAFKDMEFDIYYYNYNNNNVCVHYDQGIADTVLCEVPEDLLPGLILKDNNYDSELFRSPLCRKL